MLVFVLVHSRQKQEMEMWRKKYVVNVRNEGRFFNKRIFKSSTSVNLSRPFDPKKDSSFHQIFRLQKALLSIVKLWSPCSKKCKFISLNTVHGVSYLILVIPASVVALYWLIRSCAALDPTEKHEIHERPIIRALAALPFIVVPLRAAYILLCMGIGHVDMQRIVQHLEEVTIVSISKDKFADIVIKWKRMGFALTSYSIISFILAAVLGALHSSEWLTIGTPGQVHLKPSSAYAPFWIMVTLEVCFSWIPYIFSQLFMTSLAVCSSVLWDCFDALNDDLRCLEDRTEALEARIADVEKFTSSVETGK